MHNPSESSSFLTLLNALFRLCVWITILTAPSQVLGNIETQKFQEATNKEKEEEKKNTIKGASHKRRRVQRPEPSSDHYHEKKVLKSFFIFDVKNKSFELIKTVKCLLEFFGIPVR